ncbi:hypothetical protein BV25DRAFT_1988924 [Artomyces pyxidatus]|uniref:Uncharacterized protein n=1 Tax=Artomyces pyxidatus TaxID=48021 RepID=A0ACB8TBA5_9AGAM|nr:hypothetical protein BV25DRAFT_1988924 [Artomyces pyxidatus]
MSAYTVLEVVNEENAIYNTWMSEFDKVSTARDIIGEAERLLPGELASWKLKKARGDLSSSFFGQSGAHFGILEICSRSPAHRNRNPTLFLSGPLNIACEASPTSKKVDLRWLCDEQILGRAFFGDKRPAGMLTCSSYANGKHQRQSVIIMETTYSQSVEKVAMKMKLLVLKDKMRGPDIESSLHTGIIWEIIEDERIAIKLPRSQASPPFPEIYVVTTALKRAMTCQSVDTYCPVLN